MRTHSIAICISGQIRTPISELHEIAGAARESGADVFISVWSKIGQKTFEGAVGPKNVRRIVGKELAQILPENWLGRMKAIFPNHSSFFPENNRVEPAMMDSVFGGAKIEIEDDGPQFDFAESDSNSLRMLYKIWRANQLKIKAEEARGGRYDMVLRVRPDMLFDGTALKNLRLAPDALLVQGHANIRKDYINDMIWATSSENDDVLCGLYHKCKNASAAGWKGIHQELYGVVSAAGIKPGKILIVKKGAEIDGSKHGEISDSVGRNLRQAITQKDMVVKLAGGSAFCNLVSTVIQGFQPPGSALNKLVGELPDLLRAVEMENKNAYVQAIIYVSNICILDKTLPASDRIELMLRVLSYYSSKNALVHLEVRISELLEIFDNHIVELQHALSSETIEPAPILSNLPQSLASSFDGLWNAIVQDDRDEMRKQVKLKILSTPQFVIGFHRSLSKSGHHKEAFGLAKIWVGHAPGNWRAYDLLAGSARALGWLELAESIYREAEEKTPPNARLQELKGTLLAKIGKHEESKQALQVSLGLPGCNINRVSQVLKNVQNLIDKSAAP